MEVLKAVNVLKPVNTNLATSLDLKNYRSQTHTHDYNSHISGNIAKWVGTTDV